MKRYTMTPQKPFLFSKIILILLWILLIVFYPENIWAESVINDIRKFLDGQQSILETGPLSYSSNYVEFVYEGNEIKVPITHVQQSVEGIYILARYSLYDKEEISVFHSENGGVFGRAGIDNKEFLFHSSDGTHYEVSIQVPHNLDIKECGTLHLENEDFTSDTIVDSVSKENRYPLPKVLGSKTKNVMGSSIKNMADEENEDKNVIDIAVFYTTDSSVNKEQIMELFSRANAGLADSQANERYNTVHIEEVEPVIDSTGHFFESFSDLHRKEMVMLILSTI